MGDVANILFVCTGNIFRSMSAEYILKDLLKKKGITRYNVSSAGISAKKQGIHIEVLEELDALGIDPRAHVQRKITQEIVDDSDLIISMGVNHQDFIRENFNRDSILFNEFAIGEKTPLFDEPEAIRQGLLQEKDTSDFIRFTVSYLVEHMEKVLERIEFKCFLFVDLQSGARVHQGNLPFVPIYETENTICFMAINLPRHEDGHFLVIPKRRYRLLDEIPLDVRAELMESVNVVGLGIKKHHESYNVLLNNGIDAGQEIYHTHFHLVPRNYNDDIRIEVWNRAKLDSDKMVDYSNRLKNAISEISR